MVDSHPLPLHKVENSSDFPKRNLLSTLQRDKGSTLCSLKISYVFEGFLTGDVAVTLGCLRRAGHKNVDSFLKRTTRVGSIVNSRLADTLLTPCCYGHPNSIDSRLTKKNSSYCGISLPRTLTHDPEVIATTGAEFLLENILVYVSPRMSNASYSAILINSMMQGSIIS